MPTLHFEVIDSFHLPDFWESLCTPVPGYTTVDYRLPEVKLRCGKYYDELWLRYKTIHVPNLESLAYIYSKVPLGKKWLEVFDLEKVTIIRREMLELMTHEFDEAFTYNGFRWFDPHNTAE